MASARAGSSRQTLPGRISITPSRSSLVKVRLTVSMVSPKIIRDVLTAHRQRHRLGQVAEPGQSIAPADQKSRNFFFRRTASEQNHMVLGLAQFANRQFIDSAQKMRLVLDKPGKGSPGEPANGNRPDRVRGEAVTRGRRHSQEIAGQGKSHDLPAAVRQQLVKAHDARRADCRMTSSSPPGRIPSRRIAKWTWRPRCSSSRSSALSSAAQRLNRRTEQSMQGCSARLDRNQGNLHAPLQNRPAATVSCAAADCILTDRPDTG